MTTRIQQALKTLLAAWLVLSVLAASALVHLPDLHAKLHFEGTASCCAMECSDEAEQGHEHGSPEEHQCLIELLAAGCADAPMVADFVPVQFVAISETELLEPGRFTSGVSASAIPGRAPPVC